MKVCVIGGGAAGMMSAIELAKGGVDVVLLEKNEKLGKKIFITGKGRCNVTNDCEIQEMFGNVVHGEKFLKSALYGFTPQDTMEFFENVGLKLVVERGNRVFPFSQKSSDVIKTLEIEMRRCGVQVKLNTQVLSIDKTDGEFVVKTDQKDEICDKVIVATGGYSYQSTGSTGDGYKFAQKFGHTVIPPKPSLVPLETKENVYPMMGLSLKNVVLSVYDGKKEIFSEMGEMLFTHYGISGPLVLSASSHIKPERVSECKVFIDLKPALDEKTLDKRILRDFDEFKNKDFVNSLSKLLPQKMIAPVAEKSGIFEHKKVNEITKDERKNLVSAIKRFPLNIKDFRPVSEAIVTSGGVCVKEINPSTMESKLESGLFFAGEVIDVDAYTGGYNLQIAFSTGYLAGKNV